MVKASDIYGGDFLNAEMAKTLKLFRKTLTIDGSEVVTFNEDDEEKREEKIVVDFKETKARLVLNRTNVKTLIKKYGDETDDWPGHHVVLMKVQTSFGDSIQIDSEYDEREDPALIQVEGEETPSPSSKDDAYDDVQEVKDDGENSDPHTANPKDDEDARRIITAVSMGIKEPTEEAILDSVKELLLRGEISKDMAIRVEAQLKRKY